MVVSAGILENVWDVVSLPVMFYNINEYVCFKCTCVYASKRIQRVKAQREYEPIKKHTRHSENSPPAHTQFQRHLSATVRRNETSHTHKKYGYLWPTNPFIIKIIFQIAIPCMHVYSAYNAVPRECGYYALYTIRRRLRTYVLSCIFFYLYMHERVHNMCERFTIQF